MSETTSQEQSPDTAQEQVVSDAEREWNEAHGLTATCPVCGRAMKANRQICSWACWYERQPDGA